jgi:hypothetical protein
LLIPLLLAIGGFASSRCALMTFWIVASSFGLSKADFLHAFAVNVFGMLVPDPHNTWLDWRYQKVFLAWRSIGRVNGGDNKTVVAVVSSAGGGHSQGLGLLNLNSIVDVTSGTRRHLWRYFCRVDKSWGMMIGFDKKNKLLFQFMSNQLSCAILILRILHTLKSQGR